ncbi:MAG: biotin--[acetyl-CoA-carboxylase] ligase [Thermogutta sp.]|uniref:biotin--[acetyl-CoA-carboxylase] ligase n=1 Tax=Thermogutta terrifontis TaxID=1331910 RepID=UPI000BA85535|nr:biotin--[acetyl-CoA-carboxylase] ligase [Thermogutta terrifontis]
MQESCPPPLDLARVIRETFVQDGEVWQTIDSTNNWAKTLILRPDLPLPFLVAAEHQTAGRGRGSRRWWTGQGSLAFSVILAPPMSPSRTPTPPSEATGQHNRLKTSEETESGQGPTAGFLGLLGALSVCQAIRPLVPPTVPVGLHWPNDVYVAGRKIAGILVEVAANQRAIFGIGVNVNNMAREAPKELQPIVTSLRDICGTFLDRTDVLISILRHMESHLEALSHNPAGLTSEADRLCLQKGHQLILETEKQQYEGICRGIDGTGAILLETPEGVRKFMSGTIVRSREMLE